MNFYKKDDDFDIADYEPEPMLTAVEMEEYIDGAETLPSYGEGFFKNYKSVKNEAFYRTFARGSMRGNWDVILFTSVIYAVILGAALTVISYFLMEYMAIDFSLGSFVSWALFLGIMIAVFVLDWCYKIVYLKIVRRENPTTSSMFAGFGNFLKVAGVSIIVNLITLLGLFFLVVPGMMIYHRWCLSKYIIRDKPELSVIETLKESSCMMFGYKKKFFFLNFSFFIVIFLGLITCIIFSFFVIPLFFTFRLWVRSSICFIMFISLCIYLIPYQLTVIAGFYEDLKCSYKL